MGTALQRIKERAGGCRTTSCKPCARSKWPGWSRAGHHWAPSGFFSWSRISAPVHVLGALGSRCRSQGEVGTFQTLGPVGFGLQRACGFEPQGSALKGLRVEGHMIEPQQSQVRLQVKPEATTDARAGAMRVSAGTTQISPSIAGCLC